MGKKLKEMQGVIKQLADNQTQLRVNFATLTESVKVVDGIERRVLRLEEAMQAHSSLVYKIVGVGMAVATCLPWIMKYVHIG